MNFSKKVGLFENTGFKLTYEYRFLGLIGLSELRTKSKMNGLYVLNGSWLKAMLIFVIVALLSFGLSALDNAYRNVFDIPMMTSDGLINTDIRSFAIEAVFTVITFFIMSPLVLGMLEWYWNLSSGKKTGVGDIFGWYGSGRLYAKSLLLSLDVGVRCLLWGLLTCGIPAALLMAAEYYSGGVNLLKSNLSAQDVQRLLIVGILTIFGGLLLIGGILLFIYLTSKYIAAYFLMVEDNTRKVSEVVRDSIKYSRTYKWEITKFILSYIGWAITCIALFPLLYVVPYFCSSLTIFIKHIIYSQRSKLDNADTIRFDATNSVK